MHLNRTPCKPRSPPHHFMPSTNKRSLLTVFTQRHSVDPLWPLSRLPLPVTECCWWCVLQLFRAPRGRIRPLSQMGQDLQAHDRKWLEGLPRKQGTRSLETITETGSVRNGNRTRDLWKSTRVLLPSLPPLSSIPRPTGWPL